MDYAFPRCEVRPLADHQVEFRIGGEPRLRWHFGPQYPRPFFFPLIGPSGTYLTRMGHPGAPNHDHHRSIWFAHHKVVGIDFWSDNTPSRIRQQEWLAYEDGVEEARMAARLAWFDGHDPQPLLTQELVVAVRAPTERETLIELQATFTPQAEMFEFGQTNFGFLAVRVAKQISAHFGGGILTDSEGRTGEPAIFGQTAEWVDYSGPAPKNPYGVSFEGITYFNHAANHVHPVPWHVRSDGWMGAAPCLREGIVAGREHPLRLRFLLHAHAGPIAPERAREMARSFHESPAWIVVKSTQPHVFYAIEREA